MPYSLTDKQNEYLEYIRTYIANNESSPRLEEIAGHFKVKSPTVHKMLKALQKKGYLYFGRSSHSGFYIRLIERAGSSEIMVEVAITGKIDKYGEVYDFPKMHSHFPTLLVGANPDELFGLVAMEEIPQAHVALGDLFIFDFGKKPQPNDICLTAIGERYFLVRIVNKTFDKDILSIEMSMDYPIPEDLTKEDIEQLLNWYPLAYDESTHDYYLGVIEEQEWSIRSLSPEIVLATALRLSRQLTT